MNGQATPKILFIAGWQRSGTTILDQVLGQLPGFVSTGELRTFWLRKLEGSLCGCGATVAGCPFWRAVEAEGFRDCGPLDPASMVALQRRHVRARPRQLARVRLDASRLRGRGAPSPTNAYAQALTRLYAGIASVAGASVVVDSSKQPSDAYLLSALTSLPLYVVHLVRDPRAVAFSWTRRVRTPDNARSEYLDGFGPLASSTWWLVWNAAIDGLVRPRLNERYLRISYENLMWRPKDTIGSLCDHVGEPCEESPFLDETTVTLKKTHSVSGNPRSRYLEGPTELRPDDEWTTRMTKALELRATAPALPLLRRYGYPVLPSVHRG